MKKLILAYRDAIQSLFTPGVFWHLCWPAFVSVLTWVGLLWFGWTPAAEALRDVLHSIPKLGEWLSGGWTDVAVLAALKLLVLLVSVPLIFLLTVVLVALFALPMIIDRVARKEYGDVELRRGGSLTGSAFNALKAVAMLAIALLACLPLLFVPGLSVVTLILVSAWFNVRCFCYDALMNHADKSEMQDLPRMHRWQLAGIGIVGSALGVIPVLNLLVPIISGLAFTHYLLDALRDQRMQRRGA